MSGLSTLNTSDNGSSWQWGFSDYLNQTDQKEPSSLQIHFNKGDKKRKMTDSGQFFFGFWTRITRYNKMKKKDNMCAILEN